MVQGKPLQVLGMQEEIAALHAPALFGGLDHGWQLEPARGTGRWHLNLRGVVVL